MRDQDQYIHPDSPEIGRFIDELKLGGLSLEDTVMALFGWFDGNITYSRLNAPFFPLQRSDLDLLKMRSGTCGDYSNLVFSVMTRLGYEMRYAFVKVDCYGDPQEHICAAVLTEGRWQMIDATMPYRKWFGPFCPHRDTEILSYDEMRARLKQNEDHWTAKALEWGEESFAGLLYAPWIHEETVVCTDDALETVFFLLILDSASTYNLYVYYLAYTPDGTSNPILARVTPDETFFSFSVRKAENLWDDKQFGEEYEASAIPENCRSERLTVMMKTMDGIIPQIRKFVV